MSKLLSQEDVNRLMASPSADVRAVTATKVAQAFDLATLTEAERAIALDIFNRMVRDTEVRVRQALAENLKNNPNLPHDVAKRLAQDVAEVAVPILESSSVLREEDLLEIIAASSPTHQTAIAKRESVPEAVSEALVDRGDETVVSTLMANARAEIKERTFIRAIDRFGENEKVNEPMVRRGKLPITVAERLVTLVSESLREHLVTHHELPADMAADLLLQTRERALVGLLGEGASNADVATLVEELVRNGRLTASLVLRALCTGDLDFFETALAHLAEISVANAHTLIHDAGGKGLEALHKKCGLPSEMLPVVRVALNVASETSYDGGPADRPRFVERIIERMLTQFVAPIGSDDLEWLIGRHARAQAATRSTAA